MKNKKKSVITIVAILTAVVGVAVAVGAFLKRKAKDLGEKLDYDGSLYYEDDEDELDDEEEESGAAYENSGEAHETEAEETETPEA